MRVCVCVAGKPTVDLIWTQQHTIRFSLCGVCCPHANTFPHCSSLRERNLHKFIDAMKEMENEERIQRNSFPLATSNRLRFYADTIASVILRLKTFESTLN